MEPSIEVLSGEITKQPLARNGQWLFVLTGSCPASSVLRRSRRLVTVSCGNSNGAASRAQEGPAR